VIGFPSLIFSLLLAAAGPATGGFPAPGQTIHTVEILGVEGPSATEARHVLGIKPGDPFSPQGVQQSLRRLYLTGRFRDAVVEAEPERDGLRLRFRLLEELRIKEIVLEGHQEMAARQVREALLLKIGDPFRPERLAQAEEALRRWYEEEGFLATRVRIASEEEGRGIRVSLQESERSRIRAIAFQPAVREVDEELFLGRLGLRPGDPFKKADLAKGMDALRAWLRQQGHLAAELGPPQIRHDGPAVDLLFPLQIGHRFEILFAGNQSLSETALLEALAPVLEEGYTRDFSAESAARLATRYREKGFPFSKVEPRVAVFKADRLTRIRIEIEEGPEVRVRGIFIEGNKRLETDLLIQGLPLRPGGLFAERQLDDAANAIATTYRLQGFLDAAVVAREAEFTPDRQGAAVRFRVEEGPQTLIGAIRFEGNRIVDDLTFLEAMQSAPGTPYGEERAEDDRYRILAIYSRKGHLHARVDLEVELSADSTSATLRFLIAEGIPVALGKVILRGNWDTRGEVIRREMEVREGEAFNLERILQSQRRLTQLGIFSQVRLEPIRPETEEPSKDLLISVAERPPGALEFGLGYGELEQLRGFVSVSHRNLWGLNRRASLRLELSSLERRALFTFEEPWFRGTPTLLQFGGTVEQVRTIDEHTRETRYELLRYTLALGAERKFGESLKGALFLRYEDTKLLQIRPDTVLAREDQGRTGILSLNPSFVADTRDDPFDPKRGFYVTSTFKVSSRYIGSESDFYKLVVHLAHYRLVYLDWVVALSAKAGFGQTLRGGPELPIFERFFLGGFSTIRGFSQDSVGPKGSDGTPQGGNAMLLFNAELRVPVYRGFGLVGFVDAGNVYPQMNDIEPGSLRYSVGIGLRYHTPVGPLRLDYGINVAPRAGERRSELHFTLGHAF
jgi:outer membrane protein insertion porin family